MRVLVLSIIIFIIIGLQIVSLCADAETISVEYKAITVEEGTVNVKISTLDYYDLSTYKYPYAVSFSPDGWFLAIGLSNKTGTNYGPFKSIVKIYLNSFYNCDDVANLTYKTYGPLDGRPLAIQWISPYKLVVGLDNGLYSGQAQLSIIDVRNDTITNITYPGWDMVFDLAYSKQHDILVVVLRARSNASIELRLYNAKTLDLIEKISPPGGIGRIDVNSNDTLLVLTTDSLTIEYTFPTGNSRWSIPTGLTYDTAYVNEDTVLVPSYSDYALYIIRNGTVVNTIHFPDHAIGVSKIRYLNKTFVAVELMRELRLYDVTNYSSPIFVDTLISIPYNYFCYGCIASWQNTIALSSSTNSKTYLVMFPVTPVGGDMYDGTKESLTPVTIQNIKLLTIVFVMLVITAIFLKRNFIK